MRDMAAVAERLRLVRQARRKFLRLWAIDQALVNPLVERLADDLESPAGAGPSRSESLHGGPPPADEP